MKFTENTYLRLKETNEIYLVKEHVLDKYNEVHVIHLKSNKEMFILAERFIPWVPEQGEYYFYTKDRYCSLKVTFNKFTSKENLREVEALTQWMEPCIIQPGAGKSI